MTDRLVVRYLDRFVGASDPDDPIVQELSPITHADKLAIPLLLIHGRDDTVVPIEQSRMMAEALKQVGKQVQLVELPSEDHWLSRSETRLEMLKRTIDFLEANNPPH